MRTSLLICTFVASLAASLHAQTVTVNLDAGQLRNSDGSAVVPNGMLLQLIASPSGTFSAPTTSSYVTGDNVLISSFAMNSNSLVSGETLQTVNFTLSTTVVTGTQLLLRFYPSLTYASAPATPTALTTYGQVRSSTLEFGPTVDANETPWIVPAPGNDADLYYVTVSAGNGGTYANNTAYATSVVAVPEPSSVMLLGAAAVGLFSWAKLRRRVA